MGGNRHLRKETDYETRFRCAGGIGILREEVGVDEKGNVVRYNLAFLCRICLGPTEAGCLDSIMPMQFMNAISWARCCRSDTEDTWRQQSASFEKLGR